MKHKISTFLPIAILLSVFAVPGNATLAGSSVTGSLQFSGDPSNYFDPGYGFVPSADLNASGTTVTVSNTAVEFGYDDGAANAFSADFTDHQLTITDVVEGSGSNLGFQMMFTDTAFANQYLIPVAGPLPLIDSYSIAGDVLTLNSPGGNVTAGQTFTASFTVAPIPEPSTLGLLCMAAFAATGFLTRLSSKTLARQPGLTAVFCFLIPVPMVGEDFGYCVDALHGIGAHRSGEDTPINDVEVLHTPDMKILTDYAVLRRGAHLVRCLHVR